MDREQVTSGALKSVGYDAEARTLEVEFRTGRVYQYEGVAPETYAWLLRVENKGGFLNRMIIDRFPTREVTPVAPDSELGLEAALRASLDPDNAD
jgi:hypothetical protein